METKELKIVAPEGYTIDKEHSTLEKIIFKPIDKELPKSWEEYCKIHSMGKNETYFPSEEYSKATIALMKLIRLKNIYNKEWEPYWGSNPNIKYVITVQHNDRFEILTFREGHRSLMFKTRILAEQFLENFRDLIEIAKPLL